MMGLALGKRRHGGNAILSSLIMAVISSYVFITNARILGIVYHRERKEELNGL